MIIDKEKRTVATIMELCPLTGREVLEIGCGDGRLSEDIAPACGSFAAIDPDKDAVAAARRRRVAGTFSIGTGEQLPFSGCSFDVVIFTLSLHHHRYVQKALQESLRVLRQGGCILVIEPDAASEIAAISAIFDDETEVLRATGECLQSFPLTCTREVRREIIWRCAGADFLYNWLIDHYNVCQTDATRQQLLHLLGEKRTTAPLSLRDELVFYQLQDNPGDEQDLYIHQ